MLGEELPFGWSREIDEHGEILYYNSVKRCSTKKHPCWLDFRRILADAILKVSALQRERQEERLDELQGKFKLIIQRTRAKVQTKNLVPIKSESLADALDFYEQLIGRDVEQPPLFIQTCPIYMFTSP